MKYSIFDKQIELDDKLIELHEKYVHAISNVTLRGMAEACGLENNDKKEIESTLTQMLMENLSIVSDREVNKKILELVKNENRI